MNLTMFAQTVGRHGYLQERTHLSGVSKFSKLENNVKKEVCFYSCTTTGEPDFYSITTYKGGEYVDGNLANFTSYQDIAGMV